MCQNNLVVETAEHINDQLLRSWDIYIKFFTIFLIVNISAVGIVTSELWGNHGARLLVSILFVGQNVIATITGIKMAAYTQQMTTALEDQGASTLSTFRSLGSWGAIGNAIGHGVILVIWLAVIVVPLFWIGPGSSANIPADSCCRQCCPSDTDASTTS